MSAKTTVGVRLEERTVRDLDEIARRNGRSRSEELALAIEAHVASGTMLALPPARSGSIDPEGGLDDGAIEEFISGVLDLEVVKQTPQPLATALPLLLPRWERIRDGAPVGATPGDSPGRMRLERQDLVHPTEVGDWYTNWVEDEVESILAGRPTPDQLLGLYQAGLLPGLPTFHPRAASFGEVLRADRVARAIAGQYGMELDLRRLDGMNRRQRDEFVRELKVEIEEARLQTELTRFLEVARPAVRALSDADVACANSRGGHLSAHATAWLGRHFDELSRSARRRYFGHELFEGGSDGSRLVRLLGTENRGGQ